MPRACGIARPGFAHVADPQGKDKARQGGLFTRGNRLQKIVGALFTHAIQARELLAREPIDVGRGL